MTVKQLRKVIEGLPDDTLIVTKGFDHSYNLASVYTTEAEKTRGQFVEYHGPEYVENLENPIVTVLVAE